MNALNSELSLLDELHMTIATLSLRGTIDALKSARTKNDSSDCLFVLGEVSRLLDISIKEIRNPNHRSDKRKIAIALCVYILNKEFGYKYNKISSDTGLNLHRTILYRYSKIINDSKLVKPKTDLDRLVANNLDPLMQIVKKYKTDKNGNKEKTGV